METDLTNKVAKSGLITFHLEDYLIRGDRVLFDIKDYLFQGLVLREKDYRNALEEMRWESFAGKHVAIDCSADAVIPLWAYMLPVVKLNPFAATIIKGKPEELESYLVQKAVAGIDPEQFRDKMVLIKGCGDEVVPDLAYVEITKLLLPVVKSLMFGEPCATVPVYKKPR